MHLSFRHGRVGYFRKSRLPLTDFGSPSDEQNLCAPGVRTQRQGKGTRNGTHSWSVGEAFQHATSERVICDHKQRYPSY